MLEIKNLHLSYHKEVLKDVSFGMKQGLILGIVGKSGGGKSSLLKIIAGYVTAASGEIYYHDKKLRNANELLVPGHPNMALVQQDFGLDLYHTTKENIREKILYLPTKLQQKLVHQMLELLELEPLSNNKAIDLSGGEQQRLAIARALVSEADLILLDEPFVHLDTAMRRRVMEYLEMLNQIRNTSFIIVTHNGEEVLGLCHEVLYMKNSKIRRRASPTMFYDLPKTKEEAEFFGLINKVVVSNKQILFRPEQFSLQEGGIPLELTFEKVKRLGAVYHNFFQTNKKEQVILFNFESMENTKLIYV